MTLLAAEVRATLEFLPTDLATTNLSKPAGLVLQCLLSAKTWLLCQEGALWTSLVIAVAVVRDTWMATILRPFAVKATWWRCGTTR